MDPPTPRLRRTGRRRTEIAWQDGVTNLLYGFRMAFDSDAVGRRIVTTGGAGAEWHVHDGMHVIADTDGNGNLLRSYTWGTGIDNLLAITLYGPTATNTYQAITDHLGTVHAFVDDNGDTVESYEFDAWGNVLGVYDANGQSIPMSGIGNRYLFQGREYSWSTGLYNFRARWYDPTTGRWLSNDPIGISGGLNQYVAFGNNPVVFVDPDGNSSEPTGEDYVKAFIRRFTEPSSFDEYCKQNKEVITKDRPYVERLKNRIFSLWRGAAEVLVGNRSRHRTDSPSDLEKAANDVRRLVRDDGMGGAEFQMRNGDVVHYDERGREIYRLRRLQ